MATIKVSQFDVFTGVLDYADDALVVIDDDSAGRKDKQIAVGLLNKQLFVIPLIGGANPTVDDDETEGYRQGNVAVNVATGRLFVCLDASEGAANWGPLHLPGEIEKGATGSRPTPEYPSLWTLLFHDTTLGKVIMHNGSGWVNLDGSSL
jgi:hypothetical protein